MDYNFHTHTYRCGHANGTETEYVDAAIRAGVTHMGFSDHAPFRFPDGHESHFRVPMENAREYVETIEHLKKLYQGQITLFVGFEMEYYPLYFKKMYALAKELGAEYLILGQHYLYNENELHVATPRATAEPQHLIDYVDNVIAALKTGAFTYVAHPDCLNFTGDKEFYQKEMRRLVKAAKETGTPLEINFLGIREHRHYPNEDFWRMVGEIGAPVTFGMDAHRAKDAGDERSALVAEKMVEKYGLHYIGKPTLKPLT